jgi:SepF-like predicted cell division protein (DUF552 family)
MMENYIISKLKKEFIFWKKIIIHFLNVETDLRLRVIGILKNHVMLTKTGISFFKKIVIFSLDI